MGRGEPPRVGPRGEGPPSLRGLNDGESEVLSRLVDGLSNRQTAEELKVSVRTVEDRRARVMKKLHARSIAELVHLMATARFVRRTGKTV